MDHLEEQCGRYKRKNDDDLSKPYGHWFQEDTLSSNYRKPPGHRFGLGAERGWSMQASEVEHGDEDIEEANMDDKRRRPDDYRQLRDSEEGSVAENGKFEQNPEMNGNNLSRIDLPNLNKEAPSEGIEINHLLVIPYGEIRDIQDSQQVENT